MQEYREFTMKRILVATDFSSGSYGALNYAKQLAKTFSAKVFLLHVVDQGTSPGAVQSAPRLSDKLDIAEAELQQIASSLSHEGIACTTLARSGDIRNVVLELVREREIDLLVVGTYGKSGRSDGKLGSIAELLLRTLPCPVLTVGKGSRSNAYKSTYKHSVLFPTDFSWTSHSALPYAQCLAAHLNGDLLLLHIADNAQSDADQDALNALAREIPNNQVNKECILRSGNPAAAIAALAIERHVDFIVMGVHSPEQADHAQNYGTAFDVISKSRCPVFTLFSRRHVDSQAPAAA
ncbi:MAG TPA: universal stress protein [Acidobacteriaceae bacterium]|nr:universal stress protein [Acidobacteriaceae bacterium]